MEKWESVLSKFLMENARFLKDVDWIIMGSVATALQGCNVIPNDLDILMKRKEDVYLLARLLDKYTPEEIDVENNHTNDNWFSTKKNPVVEDEPDPAKDCWTFGRWFIDDFKIECACIEAPKSYLLDKKETDGIWEGGPETWKFKNYVYWNDFKIPVTPLEVQLETNLRRNYKQRIDEILRIFKENSYNLSTLDYCLSQKSKEKLPSWFSK